MTTGGGQNKIGGLPFGTKVLTIAATKLVQRQIADWDYFGRGPDRNQALKPYRVYGKLQHYPELADIFPEDHLPEWIYVIEGIRKKQ